jgi:hypothetical protein
MDLSIPKCTITGVPHKSKMTPKAFKAYIQTHKITYNNKLIRILQQNEPYKYLGIQLIPSLKWNLQRQISTDKLITQSKQLLASPTTIKQKIIIVNTILRPGVEYSFHAIPYSMPDIRKLDLQIITLTKAICKVPRSTPNLATQLRHKLFGMDAFSFKTAYLKCIGEQLQDALNDQGRLGTIYRGLTKYIMAKYGGYTTLTHITTAACLHSPTTHTIALLNENKIQILSFDKAFHVTCTEMDNIIIYFLQYFGLFLGFTL